MNFSARLESLLRRESNPSNGSPSVSQRTKRNWRRVYWPNICDQESALKAAKTAANIAFLVSGTTALLVDFVTVGRLQHLGDRTDRCDLVCRHRSRDKRRYWPAPASHQSRERCSARAGFGCYFCTDDARICEWNQSRHCLSEIHSFTLRKRGLGRCYS